MSKKIIYSLIGFILVSVTYIIFLSPKTTIKVTGLGSTPIAAGQVSIIISSAFSGASAIDTINKAESNTVDLITAAKKIMGEDSEIRKSFYQIAPQSDNLFVVGEAFSIKSKQINATNDFIKTMLASGANSISGINFTPSDVKKAENQVRDLAIKNAREKAEYSAKAMGKRLGRVVSVVDAGNEVGGAVVNGVNVSGSFNTVASNTSGNIKYDNITMEKALDVTFEIW